MTPSPLIASQDALRLTVLSHGHAIDASIAVLSVEVRHAVNAIPSARIVLGDGNGSPDGWPVSDGPAFVPGSTLVIQAGYGSTETALFEGVVVKAGLHMSPDGDSRLVVDCQDATVRMTRERRSAHHLDASDRDILLGLLRRHGLDAQVDTTSPVQGARIQFQCTDWDFLLARAAAHGLLVTVAQGQVCVQAPDASKAAVLRVAYGDDLLDFHVETEAASPLPADSLGRIRGHLSFPGSALARPGSRIEVAGLGRRYDGPVFVTAVEHTIADGHWRTRAAFGLDRDAVAAPATDGALPLARGLQIGTVLRLDGDPAGEHRIQIGLPLLNADAPGLWARLMQFHASDGFGAFFVPEVGDEVVVGCFGDDPGAPVVLGALYSQARPPAHALEAANSVKSLVTRSGACIEIRDEDAVVSITTPAANRIVLSDAGPSILLEDAHGNRVELGRTGITMESAGDITIRAKGSVALEAQLAVAIEAQADLSALGRNLICRASIGFSAEGGASAQLTASGTTTVQGALVLIN